MKQPLIFVLCIFFAGAAAQSRKRTYLQHELGFFGGASYYIGDLNTRNHVLRSHAAGGIFYRFSHDFRYAWRFGLSHGTISGDDALSGEPDQLERNLNFRSTVTEMSAIAEFNFVEYRIGHDHHRFTFYIFGGLAGFYFDPKGDHGDGYTALRPLHTEGQSKSYPKLQVSIPYGVGIKFNIGDKTGIGIEWGPRKTFTDYLDDVSGPYPNIVSNGGGFTDRTQNGSAIPGAMRGNPRTKDWYFYYGVTVNIKLPDPRRVCHTSR